MSKFIRCFGTRKIKNGTKNVFIGSENIKLLQKKNK